VGAAAFVLGSVAIAAVVSGSGDGSQAVSTAVTTTPAPTVPPTTMAPTVPPTEAPTTTTTEPDPGSLPQTPDKPSGASAKLAEHASALWQAIVSDDPSVAAPAFFPLGAYLQVKAISNPESDWRTRLVAGYVEDIHALHAKLGAKAGTAQLVGMDVPESQAVWVKPGVEYNKGSYWRVYGAQLRYTADGQSGSFPIASMISWRGEWYVVHLNSIR